MAVVQSVGIVPCFNEAWKNLCECGCLFICKFASVFLK